MIAKQSLTKSRVDFAFSVSFGAARHANRFLYTGREFLQEVGLYDYRNRFYFAELGRFLQSDPIRFDAGDYNLYRYVSNRVTRSTDAMGLAESSCSERRIDPRGDEDGDGNPNYRDDKDGIDFDGDGKDFEKNTRRDNDNRGGGGGGGGSCVDLCLWETYGTSAFVADALSTVTQVKELASWGAEGMQSAYQGIASLGSKAADMRSVGTLMGQQHGGIYGLYKRADIASSLKASASRMGQIAKGAGRAGSVGLGVGFGAAGYAESAKAYCRWKCGGW